MINPADMPTTAPPQVRRLDTESAVPHLEEMYEHSRTITEMVHKRLVLQGLLARVKRAEGNLIPTNERLHGKLEGVRLIRSYIEEELR